MYISPIIILTSLTMPTGGHNNIEFNNRYFSAIKDNTKGISVDNTLKYNVQTMQDINDYQNAKILNSLFEKEYESLKHK